MYRKMQFKDIAIVYDLNVKYIDSPYREKPLFSQPYLITHFLYYSFIIWFQKKKQLTTYI